MMKKVGIIKRIFALLLIFLLSINSFAAVVSDNDGSAFITKAEFDSLKNNFQSQIDSYNQSIDSKIDGAIASYLAGIQIQKQEQINTFCGSEKSASYRTFAKYGTNFVSGLNGTRTDISAFINGVFIWGSTGTSTARSNLTISNYNNSFMSTANVDAVNYNDRFGWLTNLGDGKYYLDENKTVTPCLQFIAAGFNNTWDAADYKFAADGAKAPTGFTLDASSYSAPCYFTKTWTGLWDAEVTLYCSYSIAYEDRGYSLMANIDYSLYGAVDPSSSVSYLDSESRGKNIGTTQTWDVDQNHRNGDTYDPNGGAYLWLGTQTGNYTSHYYNGKKFAINVKAKDVKRGTATLGGVLNRSKSVGTGLEVNYFNGIPLVKISTGKTGRVKLNGHLASLPSGTTRMVIKNTKFEEDKELSTYTSSTTGVVLSTTLTNKDFVYEIPIDTPLTDANSTWWIKFDNSSNNTIVFYFDPLEATWD